MAPRTKERRDQFRERLGVAEVWSLLNRAEYLHNVSDVPTVYHYTDAKGLIGILSEGRLWATDIRYLNDSSELRHAEEIQRQVIDEIVSTSPDGSLQRKLSAKAYHGMHLQTHNPYVVCFCEEDDLLTQWKTYGSWGSGFSVGFDRRKLTAATAPPPASPVEVLLSEDTKVDHGRVQ